MKPTNRGMTGIGKQKIYIYNLISIMQVPSYRVKKQIYRNDTIKIVQGNKRVYLHTNEYKGEKDQDGWLTILVGKLSIEEFNNVRKGEFTPKILNHFANNNE